MTTKTYSRGAGVQRIEDTLRRHLTDMQVSYVLARTHTVLDCPRFHQWPASLPGKDGKLPKHHGEEGGLLRHTNEVLSFALGAGSATTSIDAVALATGAIWHDVGKLREYDKNAQGIWFRATPLISHICHGLQMWACAVDSPFTRSDAFSEHVTHLIASHHGRKEWGSPVVPATLEALILHSADCQSLMLDGADNPAARS